MSFKRKALAMSNEEFAATYREVDSVLMERETDLNAACFAKILESIVGDTVLEVGAGKGLLAKRLSERYRVTACDITIDPKLARENISIRLEQGNIECLPFESKQYDTVVCTHTLEHVRNISRAIGELRRVAKRRMIVVVPNQRPYRYTFDLHLHFFPYEHSLLALIGNSPSGSLSEISGDWFYVEDQPVD